MSMSNNQKNRKYKYYLLLLLFVVALVPTSQGNYLAITVFVFVGLLSSFIEYLKGKDNYYQSINRFFFYCKWPTKIIMAGILLALVITSLVIVNM